MKKITLHYPSGDKEFVIGTIIADDLVVSDFKYNYTSEMIEFQVTNVKTKQVLNNYLRIKYVPFSIIQ